MRLRAITAALMGVATATLVACSAGDNVASTSPMTTTAERSTTTIAKPSTTRSSPSSTKPTPTTSKSNPTTSAGTSSTDVQVFQFGIDNYGDGKSTISTQEIAELGKTFCLLYTPSKGGDNTTQLAAASALMIKAGVSPADTAVSSQVAVELYCPQEKPYFDQMKSVLAPG